MLSIPLDTLPEGFPHQISNPRFQLGDRVQWQPQPCQDFGTITGIQYAPASHLQAWAWKYIIWLDRHSPSRSWVITDTAWEIDLEPLTAVTHSQGSLENEQP